MIKENIQVYHATNAISHSKLEMYRRRPQLYYRRVVQKSIPQPEPTSAFKLGSAVHCMVLETHEFENRYVLKPDFDRRTKEGKQLYSDFIDKHLNKTVLDIDDMDCTKNMANAVYNHELSKILLSEGFPELTWRVPQPNLLSALQCRTDWYNPKGCELTNGRPYIVDLKTVESLDSDAFRNFERAVFSFGYHRQAGFYLPLITETGNPVYDFFFIAVEKNEPFGVAVYRLSDSAISKGQDETLQDLRALKLCYETSNWPNIENKIFDLELPKWYKNE